MANPSDMWVVESPKTLAVGESRAYAIDFSDAGTPSVLVSVKVYDSTGTEQAALLTGAGSLVGAVVTTGLFSPASEQNYRLIVAVTISGQTKFGAVDVAAYDKTHTAAATGVNSYGTLVNVAVLVPKYVNRAGRFDDTTTPTGAQVAMFIDQVSSVVNGMLSQKGFVVPVSAAMVVPALAMFVESEVAAMVEGVNGSGRFGPTIEGRRASGGKSRLQLIWDDVSSFIADFATGIENMGATRTGGELVGLGFREYDESGDAVSPLFQRKGWGEVAQDWDV